MLVVVAEVEPVVITSLMESEMVVAMTGLVTPSTIRFLPVKTQGIQVVSLVHESFYWRTGDNGIVSM